MASLKAVKAGKSLFLSEMPGRFKDKAWALRKIEAARNPTKEARRLIEWFESKGVYTTTNSEDREEPDLSDVQVLRVQLYRKNGSRGWHPSDPQYRLLNALERDVATGGVDWTEFHTRASIVAKTVGGLLPNSYYLEQEKILAEGKQAFQSKSTLSPALQINYSKYDLGPVPPLQPAPKGSRLFETDKQFDEPLAMAA